jgi:hypothetical protein
LDILFQKSNDKNGGKTTPTSGSSRIEIAELASKVLPQALDCMYFPEQPLKISTTTAAGLFHLGKTLDMKQLLLEPEQFWRNDFRMDSIVMYYEHSKA